jgi:hypothetical protein
MRPRRTITFASEGIDRQVLGDVDLHVDGALRASETGGQEVLLGPVPGDDAVRRRELVEGEVVARGEIAGVEGLEAGVPERALEVAEDLERVVLRVRWSRSWSPTCRRSNGRSAPFP